MKILITNGNLNSRSGTEILTLNLATTLKRLGHQVSVYSPSLGAIAEDIRAIGVPVTDDISTITDAPDIIHGHHTLETAAAILRFPDKPAIFVCHDFTAWHDEAPKLPNIRYYSAISDTFQSRLTQIDGIVPDRTGVILNAIDTDAYRPGPALPQKPMRALIFAKSIAFVDAIEQACRSRNIQTTVVGMGVGNIIDNYAEILPQYDLVFASGLTAMEAMATGRPVVCCDARGLAGMVTSDNVESLRHGNFGLQTFNRDFTVENVTQDIALYDAQDAARVSEYIRTQCDLQAWAQRYVDLYERAIADFNTAYPRPELPKPPRFPWQKAQAFTLPPSPADDLSRAAATFLQKWSTSRTRHLLDARQQRLDHTQKRLDSFQLTTPLDTLVQAADTTQLYLQGFYPTEVWGAWASKPVSSVRLTPDAPFSRLRVMAYIYVPTSRPEFTVEVRLNGKSIGQHTLSTYENTLDFTFDTVSEHAVWLDFITDEGLQPTAEGKPDSRYLGFGLRALEIGN